MFTGIPLAAVTGFADVDPVLQEMSEWAIGERNAAVELLELGIPDLPPLKWSSLKYGFAVEDRIDGKEEAYS